MKKLMKGLLPVLAAGAAVFPSSAIAQEHEPPHDYTQGYTYIACDLVMCYEYTNFGTDEVSNWVLTRTYQKEFPGGPQPY